MLRTQEPRAVVTFATTAAALHLEQAARSAGLPGRLIPVPRALTAGCGLAWSAPPDTADALRALLAREHIAAQAVVILTI